MASGWNLWVWLQCIGVASQCYYKEVYRYPHNNWRAERAPHLSYSGEKSSSYIYIKHLKMNKEVRMLLPKKDLIQVE